MRPCSPAVGRACLALALLTATFAALAGCAHRRPVVVEGLRSLERRVPLILLPGITGSRLADTERGTIAWGDGRSFFGPRDGGYAIAHPIPDASEDRLGAAGAITRIRLPLGVKIDVYASTVRVLEANGYHLGDVGDPQPGDDLFLFDYDWRESGVTAAQELSRWLERLRRVRGERTLEVDLLCQSNAGRIARYFVRFGGASLAEAEQGVDRRPPGVVVRKVILVGTANGGALRTLRDLQRGRRYVPVVGRRFRPEVVFTFPSIYEALPAYGADFFFDPDGNVLSVDLYDPASWETYGWSIHDRAIAKRIERSGRDDLFGDAPGRRAFLAGALDRARRMHRLLMGDAGDVAPTRYYLIQNAFIPTPRRARLRATDDGWSTRIDNDRDLDEDDHRWTLSHAPGDGHATLESQMWMSDVERRAIARPPVHVPAAHRRIITRRAAHRWILEFLRD